MSLIKLIAPAMLLTALVLPTLALAKSTKISSVNLKYSDYKVAADLYFDPDTKRPDIFINFEQGLDSTKVTFKATSIEDRLKEADIKLVPMPLARIDGFVSLIYDGRDIKTGNYAGDKSVAVLFRYPANALPNDALELFNKEQPKTIVRDGEGHPLYVKAVLCRVTYFQVFPIAAFDVDLPL